MDKPHLKEAYKSLDGLTDYFNGWAKKAREDFYFSKIDRLAAIREAESYIDRVQITRENLDQGKVGHGAYGWLWSLWFDNSSVAKGFAEAGWFERTFRGAAKKAEKYQEMNRRLKETLDVLHKAVPPQA